MKYFMVCSKCDEKLDFTVFEYTHSLTNSENEVLLKVTPCLNCIENLAAKLDILKDHPLKNRLAHLEVDNGALILQVRDLDKKVNRLVEMIGEK